MRVIGNRFVRSARILALAAAIGTVSMGAGITVASADSHFDRGWHGGHHHWRGFGPRFGSSIYFGPILPPVYYPPPPVYYPAPPVYVPAAPAATPPLPATPTSPVYRAADGQYCREYQATIVVGGTAQQSYGTACRQPDGVWRVVR